MMVDQIGESFLFFVVAVFFDEGVVLLGKVADVINLPTFSVPTHPLQNKRDCGKADDRCVHPVSNQAHGMAPFPTETNFLFPIKFG